VSIRIRRSGLLDIGLPGMTGSRARESSSPALVEGHNYKTAAAELGVSVNTIAFHMKHVYVKLQVHSKSEAVAKALKSRVV
jgi:DNA-binding NarL/FixJ family response regulator